jgi:LCP family protein required for cell wall assembly
VLGAVSLLALLLCGLASGLLTLSLPRRDGRVNILVLGIDRRDEPGWVDRTDTIMIATLAPEARRAGLLSIPRDLELTIPTVGEDRINTANVYGAQSGYPGGGPGLVKATVETNFGIPIDGYLMLDFGTFEHIVDSLGGIDVNVPRALDDDRYPDPRPGDPYAFKSIHFDAGPQHMDGRQALEYARSRMSTSDFDRAARQQLVLLAIRRRALSAGGILRWPAVALAALRGVKTDLNPFQLAALARLAVLIGPSRLEQRVIEAPLVDDYTRPDGAQVLLPNWELLRPAIEEMFGAPPN